MAAPEISTVILPNTWSPEALRAILPKYKAFRLHALKTAPRAFARTYEQEVVLPYETWEQRLTNPNAIHFVAVSAGADDQNQSQHEQWVGSLVLVRKVVDDDGGGGRKEMNSFDGGLHDDHQDHSAVVEEGGKKATLTFHMNAVFLNMEVRGRGVGKMLLRDGIAFVMDEARRERAGLVRITALVDSDNLPAIGLYSSQGFVKIGIDRYLVDQDSREAIEMELVLEIGDG